MVVNKSRYPALDIFRLVAATLVVAIHTMPLYSLSPTVDFALTRVLGRVAVPFFFMCSGFFVLGNGHAGRGRVLRFFRKTGTLYLVALAIYLPLMAYGAYFSQPLWQIANGFLWEGPFYHLWYFPAALWGMALCSLLLRCTPRLALAVSALLYITGLLGDSYHGFVTQLPALEGFYNLIGTTRNGLFFAPLFLLLGRQLALKHPEQSKRNIYGLLFGLLLAGMVLEGLSLYQTGGMRGDVMYLLLPFTMWALFSWLCCLPAKREHTACREISMWVYILHPWAIALLRPVLARLLRSEEVMTTHSLLFFACVLLASFTAAYLLHSLLSIFRAVKKPAPRAVASIDLDRLAHNLTAMRGVIRPGCEIIAVVKANAYGHGAVRVSRHFYRHGVRWFAVATPSEALELRLHGVRGNILVLGYTPPLLARVMRHLRITLTAVDAAHAYALAGQDSGVRVHLKIDTGMHRLGETADAHAIAPLYKLPGIRVTGIYTHFACADSRAEDAQRQTHEQAGRFFQLLQALAAQGIQPGMRHMQSSYGVLNYPELCCDAARLGLALYGVVKPDTKVTPNLLPALRLTARVACVKEVAAGDFAGYDNAHVCDKNSRIAWVTVGYADGFPRSLTGYTVHIHGYPAPVIGRICMDRLCIDVTGLPQVAAGDEVTMIQDGASTLSMAKAAGTIPNDILAGLGLRVQRCYHQGDATAPS